MLYIVFVVYIRSIRTSSFLENGGRERKGSYFATIPIDQCGRRKSPAVKRHQVLAGPPGPVVHPLGARAPNILLVFAPQQLARSGEHASERIAISRALREG